MNIYLERMRLILWPGSLYVILSGKYGFVKELLPKPKGLGSLNINKMISPREVMKGSLVSYEGNPQVVKTVGEYIILEGWKEWISGSLINPEPLTEDWLTKLAFVKTDNEFYWADPKTSRIVYIRHHKENSWLVSMSVSSKEPMNIKLVSYVHEIQLTFFGIIGEHLVLPKLKK